MNLETLLREYGLARGYTHALVGQLDAHALTWRPSEDSSAIGWHLGHQAAVAHFMLRNLTAAEPSLDPGLDQLFDSAGPERQRGALPPVAAIEDFRATVATRVEAMARRVAAGDVAAPAQMDQIVATLLCALINHEYQHDCWIEEMRVAVGAGPGPKPDSSAISLVDGYWLLTP